MSDVNAVNKPRETDDVPVPPTLRKSLKNRHIQLIALGGAIGTGLFYGSSESIGLAGPSILLAYLIVGLAIFLIVRALSEMAVEDPKAGAFSYYATRYWSKRAGFISGWNYWFNYVLVAMVELSVVGSFVNYWFPNIPKWVSAVVFLVAIAAPHDGSTFLDVQPDAANALSTLFLGAARALGISAFKDVYDFRLDQFGIRRDPDEPITTAALRMLAQNPLPAGDSAFDDLRCAGARALNARIATLPDAWYFSIPCCRTLPRLLTHDQKPDTAMTPLLWPFSTAMGRAGGAVPSDWLPNDGLVNTVSARYPGGAPHTDCAPGQTPQRGVWQVLPVEELDHLAAIGGVMNTGVVRTRMFYRRVMALLDAAAAADANS